MPLSAKSKGVAMKLWTTLALILVLAIPAFGATYYVDGALGTDDGAHGTGSGANAWKTLTYALSTSGIPAAGGHTLLVADGTYAEGTTVGLVCGRAYTDWVTVRPLLGEFGSVTVTAGSANYLTALCFTTTGKIRFERLTFAANGTGETSLMLVRWNGDASNFYFKDCFFNLPAQARKYAAYCANIQVTNVTFDSCQFDATGAAGQYGIVCLGTTGKTPSGWLVKDCTITSTSGVCIQVVDSTNLTVRGCTLSSAGAIVLQFQKNGVANINNGLATIYDNTITATGTTCHAVLIGTGSVGSLAYDNVLDASGTTAGYGFVLQGSGDTVRDNTIIAGGNSGLYVKGSTDVTLLRNVVTQAHVGGVCIRSATGIANTSGTVISDCICHATAGTVFGWQGHENDDSVSLNYFDGALGTNLPSNGVAMVAHGEATLGTDTDLDGVTVDFGSARIVVTANVTLDATDATSVANTGADFISNGSGKTLTLDHFDTPTGAPLRAWCGCTDGGNNTAGAIEFHNGPPAAGTMMGISN